MAKRFPYFNFFPADFLEGTAFLTDEEVGCYIRLLSIQWGHGRLPTDLSRLERYSPSIQRSWSSIACKFKSDDGGYFNQRLEDERARAMGRSAINSENGSRGGKAKANRGERLATATATAKRPLERSPEIRSSETLAISDSDSDSDSDSAPKPDSQPELLSAAAPPPAPTRTPKPVRSKPKDTISWSPETSWQGITEADRQRWAVAYPACDLTIQLAQAEDWLISHPAEANKSAWRRFITGWLSRSQQKGGDVRTARYQQNGTHHKPTVEEKSASLLERLRSAPSRRNQA